MRDLRRSRDKTGFLSMTATDPASTGSLECAAPPATGARHHAPDRGALGITPCLGICSLGRHLIDGGHAQSYRHRHLEHDIQRLASQSVRASLDNMSSLVFSFWIDAVVGRRKLFRDGYRPHGRAHFLPHMTFLSNLHFVRMSA